MTVGTATKGGLFSDSSCAREAKMQSNIGGSLFRLSSWLR